MENKKHKGRLFTINQEFTNALIIVLGQPGTDNNRYMYLDSALPPEQNYIEFGEEFYFDDDLDFGFPREQGLYKILVSFTMTDDSFKTTVIEYLKVHDLKL